MPDGGGSVMHSMHDINKQERRRDASIMAAEVEKAKVVKAAEARLTLRSYTWASATSPTPAD